MKELSHCSRNSDGETIGLLRTQNGDLILTVESVDAQYSESVVLNIDLLARLYEHIEDMIEDLMDEECEQERKTKPDDRPKD